MDLPRPNCMVGSSMPKGAMGRLAGSWHSIKLPWYWQYQADWMRKPGGATSEQCTGVPRGLPDDPVDGVDEDVSAVVTGWDLVRTVAWS